MTRLKNRTCQGCGDIVSSKHALKGVYCRICLCCITARTERKKWLDNKSDYVILDVETTGFGAKDEIIEINIMDLDGQVLFYSLVMPTEPISHEAYEVHAISLSMLIEAGVPSWSEIYLQVKDTLKDKTFIAYNAEFDNRMLEQSCAKYGLQPMEASWICLMQNIMFEHDSNR